MRFSISSDSLKAAAKEAVRVIEVRTPLPILTSVVACQRDKEIYLLAGDGDCLYRVGAGAALECEDIAEGRLFCVNGSSLKGALASLAEQPITVEYGNGAVALTHASGTMKMPADNAEEYPVPKDAEDGCRYITFAPGLLQECFGKASVAADEKNPVRPVMECVNVRLKEDGGVDIVASDGQKLVRCALGADKVTTDMGAGDSILLVPKAGVLLGNAEGSVTMRADGHRARLAAKSDRRAISIQLVEGKYPDYERVIPTAFSHEFTVEARQLISALRRVTPFSDDSSHLVTLSFHGGTLMVEAEDRAFQREAAERVAYEGGAEDYTIGFKGTSLMELLRLAGDGAARIRMTEPSKAVVIEPAEQNENYRLTLLLMPIMLN